MADDQKQQINSSSPAARSEGPAQAMPDQASLLNFAMPSKRPDPQKRAKLELNLPAAQRSTHINKSTNINKLNKQEQTKEAVRNTQYKALGQVKQVKNVAQRPEPRPSQKKQLPDKQQPLSKSPAQPAVRQKRVTSPKPSEYGGFPQWLQTENSQASPRAGKISPKDLSPNQAAQTSRKSVNQARPSRNAKSSAPVQAPGFKGNIANDPKLDKNNLKRSHAESNKLQAGERYATRRMQGQPKNDLTKALTKLQQERKSGKKKTRLEAWQQEQLKGAKVYKLTAYTTTDNIDKRFRSIQRQSILRKILVTLIIILMLATLAGSYLNLSDTSNLKSIVGDQVNDQLDISDQLDTGN